MPLFVGQVLLLKVIYSSEGKVIFIEGHANHKQVNQTPFKVRFSLFEGALLFIMDYFIFFFIRKCQLDYSQSKIV